MASQEIFESAVSEENLSSLFDGYNLESLHLDFKQVPTGKNYWETLKPILAKAISGFSNADGGTLILGVREKDDGTFELDPIDDYEVIHQRVQENIGRLTDPANHLIETKRISSVKGGGYVVLHIPSSDYGPHQNIIDKKYYQRAGESHQPMAHFQIADLFGRRPQPALSPILKIRRDVNSGGRALIAELKIVNGGRGIAKHAFVAVSSIGSLQKKQHYTSWFHENSSFRDNSKKYYTSPADAVVHSELSVPVQEYHFFFDYLQGFTEGSATIEGIFGCEGMITKKFRLVLEKEQIENFQRDPNYQISDLESSIT